MPIIRQGKRTQFVVVDSRVANDSRLSFEARGVILYLLSKPDGWLIQNSDIENAGGINPTGTRKGKNRINRDKRQRILKELETAGYLERNRFRDINGKFDFELILHETPVFIDYQPRPEKPVMAAEPQPGYPSPGKPSPGKPSPVNPVIYLKNDLINNNLVKKDGNEDGTAPASGFEYLANICFGFPFDKSYLLKGKNRERVETAVSELEALDADFSLLRFFPEFWTNDWRSLDRRYKKFQAIRPEQFAEIWFEFLNSKELTEQRKGIEENAKQQIDETNQNAGRNAGRIKSYDYSKFANVGFDD